MCRARCLTSPRWRQDATGRVSSRTRALSPAGVRVPQCGCSARFRLWMRSRVERLSKAPAASATPPCASPGNVNGRIPDGLAGVIHLAVGDGHSCAVTRDNSVQCWGASKGSIYRVCKPCPPCMLPGSDAALATQVKTATGRRMYRAGCLASSKLHAACPTPAHSRILTAPWSALVRLVSRVVASGLQCGYARAESVLGASGLLPKTCMAAPSRCRRRL